MKKFISMVCIVSILLSVFAMAYAEAPSGTTEGYNSFMVRTSKNAGCKLTIKPKSGTIQGTAWKNPFKLTTKTVYKKKQWGEYKISVTGPSFSKTVTMKNKAVSFKLPKKKSTYYVSVVYLGWVDRNVIQTMWDCDWKEGKTCSWKAKVNFLSGAKFQ